MKGEYKRGTLAMARTAEPDSQGSQFFIVLSDDPAGPILESYRTYAIFGEVIDGHGRRRRHRRDAQQR